MANIFTALGAPEAQRAINTFLDRPREEEEWGMKKQLFQSNQAVNKLQLEKFQMENKRMKEQEALDNEPIDLKLELKASGLPEEGQAHILNRFEESGRSKNGFLTRKVYRETMKAAAENQPLMEGFMSTITNAFRQKADKDLDTYLKYQEKPKEEQNPIKLKELKDAFEISKGKVVEARKGSEQITQSFLDKAEMVETINKWKASGEWGAMKPEERQAYEGAVKGRKKDVFEKIGMIRMQESLKKREVNYQKAGITDKGVSVGYNPNTNTYVATTPQGTVPYDKNVHGILPDSSTKRVSMGNASELAMNEKFPGWMEDLEISKKAHTWLGTNEGKQKVQEWAQRTTPPSYTFPVTSEGIVPAISRGPGAGTMGQPTGYKKPLSDAQLAKIGELNSVLKNIEKTKELYGYGTKKEHEEWVGPVAGRMGGLGGKYLGTASPEQVEFYSYVKDMQDALLRARSGAQINEQEYKRLVAFLPDPNLPPITFKAKLKRFEEATNIVLEEKLGAYEKGGLGIGNLKSTTKQTDLRKKYNY